MEAAPDPHPRPRPRAAPGQPAGPPLAVLVSGPPASGKSTVAAAVARRLRGALLDLDVVTGALTAVVAELVGIDDLDDPVLRARTRAARYEAVLAGAADSLRVGTPVVAAAPFTAERSEPARWQAVGDRLRAAGGRPVLVWLRLPPDELVRRMRARAAARDRAKLDDPAAFLGGGLLGGGVLDPPVVEHVAVDATAALPAQVDAIFSAFA